ncbi:MAG: FUSC family protein [Oscillospiraceae bacterium]|nr:FUSC family protein [Oscillospiraceae bacterium]
MKRHRFHVGLRTVKTSVAIVVAMILVEPYGATSARLIFAMLGAMAVVQPTFKESLEACVTQIVGVIFGALAGVLLVELPTGPLTSVLLGVIFVITVYNLLPSAFSPSLPCFILVMVCTDAEMAPIGYALGRIWDTAIGLGVGMIINMAVFPYDNSRQIRETIEGLDKDLLLFLEDMFDGDTHLPGPGAMNDRIDALKSQLSIFANQRLLLHLRRQKRTLERYQACERKARELVSHLEVLSQLDRPGRLSGENRRRLAACGAKVAERRELD